MTVAPSVGGDPELIIDVETSLLVPADDAYTIAVIAVLNRPDRAWQTARRTRAKVESSVDWSWRVKVHCEVYSGGQGDTTPEQSRNRTIREGVS